MIDPREINKRLKKLELENSQLKLEVTCLDQGIKGLFADIEDLVRQLRKAGIQLEGRLKYTGMVENK